MRRLMLNGLVLAAAALTAWPASSEERFVTVGTAGVTSSYYAAGGAICRMVNSGRAEHGLRCAVEPTGGSVYNVNTIRAGELDFGIVRSDREYDAVKGQGPFAAQQPDDSLRAVFTLQGEPLTILVRADSPVRDLGHLRYRRVLLGDRLSSQRLATEAIFNAFHWSGLTAVDGDGAPGKTFCGGAAEALAFTTAHPSAAVKEAIRCPVRIVPVVGPGAARVLSDFPYYRAAPVPGGMYSGNPDYVESLGPSAVLVTSAATPAEAVYTLTASVFDDFARFHLLHPTLYRLQAEEMAARETAAPLHEGALRYFRERGWR